MEKVSLTVSKIFLLHCRVKVRRDSLHNCQEKRLSFAKHHIAYFHAIFVVFLFSFNAEALTSPAPRPLLLRHQLQQHALNDWPVESKILMMDLSIINLLASPIYKLLRLPQMV